MESDLRQRQVTLKEKESQYQVEQEHGRKNRYTQLAVEHC